MENWKEDYEQVINNLRSLIKNDSDHVIYEHDILERIPELKESDDEKIRKWIIAYLENRVMNTSITDEKDNCLDAIRWLEKQSGANKEYWRGYREGKKEIFDKYSELEKRGEQKPADKVKPKFKTGDIIIPKDGGHEPWQIMQVDILDKKYRFKDGYVIHFSQEDDYELVEQKPADTDNKFIRMRETKPKDISEFLDRLTTVEQEFLWEHIAKIRELDKEEQKPATWSEEDELHIKELESLVKQVWATAEHENDKETIHKMSDLSFFLKTLKPQLKQEWSEEDETELTNTIIMIKEGASLHFNKKDITKAVDWLKSLRPQNHWKPSEEQMGALFEAHKQMSAVYHMPLITLYNDLKKLQRNRI